MEADRSKAKGGLRKGVSSRGRSHPGNAAGRPTAVELEKRKAKVVEVATALFIQHGYATPSLVEIAKQSGVATRTVYEHFGDKEGLFRSVMFARDSAAVFPPPHMGKDEPLFDFMLRLADYLCTVAFRQSTVDLMRLVIAESKRFPKMMRELIQAADARFRANVRSVFKELANSGLVDDDDTDASAEMFIHLVLGDAPLYVHIGWKDTIPSKPQLAAKVELFMLGRWRVDIAASSQIDRSPKRRAR